MSNISSITTGPRQSNFELLRIVSMFLVLIVHADFWAIGGPDAVDFASNPSNAFTRTFIESLSIVCVNVFVLISGWFGIKPNSKGLFSFVFQCAFFLFGLYVAMILANCVSFSIKGIAGCLCLISGNWFVLSYVGLYILSPIINAFIDKASKHQIEIFLITFFLFQSIWGWIGKIQFIDRGYSTFSFIGLYVLARYCRKHLPNKLKRWGGAIYIICTALVSITYYLFVRYGIGVVDVFTYINPLVIMSSLGLLLWFSQLNIKPNRLINWIAKSAFAVFLLHSDPYFGTFVFKAKILQLYRDYNGIECICMIFVFLCTIYLLGTLIDQPRKWLWTIIAKRF